MCWTGTSYWDIECSLSKRFASRYVCSLKLDSWDEFCLLVLGHFVVDLHWMWMIQHVYQTAGLYKLNQGKRPDQLRVLFPFYPFIFTGRFTSQGRQFHIAAELQWIEILPYKKSFVLCHIPFCCFSLDFALVG